MCCLVVVCIWFEHHFSLSVCVCLFLCVPSDDMKANMTVGETSNL